MKRGFLVSTAARIAVVMLFVFIGMAGAAPSHGEVFELRQPDGSRMPAAVWGDVFYMDMETPDGYTLTRDADGWLVYADLSADGREYISTGVRYTDGSIAPDVPKGLRISRESVWEKRYGKMEEMGYLDMLREGPRRHPRTSAAAPAARGIAPAPIEPERVVGVVIKEFYDYTPAAEGGGTRGLITDALNILDGMNLDLSEVTLNANGRVQLLNVFHAGTAQRDGMWLHSATYSGGATVNGVGFGRYQLSSLSTSTNLSSRLALVVHENGHLLMRWPDIYDHGDLSIPGRGIGHWCVMATQTGFPQQPNAFFRYLAGWIDVTDITGAVPGTVLTHTANSHSAYVYRRSGQEAYFIEARRREGVRNQAIPGSGLAIWRTHTGGSNTNENVGFPRVALMQADGRNDLENRVNRGDGTDLFRLGLRAKFNSTTNPAAVWHDGVSSTFSISGISDSGAVMSFIIGDNGIADVRLPKYRFYDQVMAYATATGNVEAVVDENFTLDMLISP